MLSVYQEKQGGGACPRSNTKYTPPMYAHLLYLMTVSQAARFRTATIDMQKDLLCGDMPSLFQALQDSDTQTPHTTCMQGHHMHECPVRARKVKSFSARYTVRQPGAQPCAHTEL